MKFLAAILHCRKIHNNTKKDHSELMNVDAEALASVRYVAMPIIQNNRNQFLRFVYIENNHIFEI